MNATHTTLSALVLCRIGGLTFGIPLDAVVQAVSKPALTPLPRRDGALVGVFDFRGQPLPLVDVRRWLPIHGSDQEELEQTVLLRLGHQVLGLAVCQVLGMRRVRPGDVQRVHQGHDGDELFHSVAKVGDSAFAEQVTVGVLDVPALMRLSQVWCIDQGAPEAQAGLAPVSEGRAVEPSAGAPVPHALLVAGSRLLAIRVERVQAVQAMPDLQKVFGRHDCLLGVARWRGHDVAVLQPLAALGCGGATQVDAPLMAVLAYGGHFLGIAVQEARAVQALDLGRVQSPASAGLPTEGGWAGLLRLPHGEDVLLLDPDALQAHVLATPESPQAADALMGSSASGVQTVGNGDKETCLNPQSLVVFQAGQPWALSIDLLESIVGCTTDIDGSTQSDAAHLGSMSWNGRTVAVWDLRVLCGLAPAKVDGESRIVLVRHGGHVRGLLVERLLLLLPMHAGDMSTLRRHNGEPMQLVTTRHSVPPKSYQVLQLNGLRAWGD